MASSRARQILRALPTAATESAKPRAERESQRRLCLHYSIGSAARSQQLLQPAHPSLAADQLEILPFDDAICTVVDRLSRDREFPFRASGAGLAGSRQSGRVPRDGVGNDSRRGALAGGARRRRHLLPRAVKPAAAAACSSQQTWRKGASGWPPDVAPASVPLVGGMPILYIRASEQDVNKVAKVKKRMGRRRSAQSQLRSKCRPFNSPGSRLGLRRNRTSRRCQRRCDVRRTRQWAVRRRRRRGPDAG
jgi:hypothetical protein